MKKLLLSLLLILSISTPLSAITIRSIIGGAVLAPIPPDPGTMAVLQSITIPTVQEGHDLVLVGNNVYVLVDSGGFEQVSKLNISTLSFDSTVTLVNSISPNRNQRIFVNTAETFLAVSSITGFITPIRLSTFTVESATNLISTTVVYSAAIDGNILHAITNDSGCCFTRLKQMNITTIPFIASLRGDDIIVEGGTARSYQGFTRGLPLYAARNTGGSPPSFISDPTILDELISTTPRISINSMATTALYVFVGGVNGQISRSTRTPFVEDVVLAALDPDEAEISELLIIGSVLYATDRTGRIIKIDLAAMTVTESFDAGFGRIEGIIHDSSTNTLWLVADEANVVTLFELSL